MNIHLFTDWQYVGEAPKLDAPHLLNALIGHQFRNGTRERHIYTAIDMDSGYAFSQWYRKEGEGKCSHGHMFKHEAGLQNPDAPSYFDLVTVVEQRQDDVVPHHSVLTV